MIKGKVQAGVWMSAVHYEPEDWVPVSLPVPPEYENCDPFILKVAGDSMDEVYPDGTLITCVATMNLNREVRHQERVIVERRDADGRVELTVKEYRADGPRKWLVARSTRPEFAGAIEMIRQTTDTLQVVAVVVAAYRFERP